MSVDSSGLDDCILGPKSNAVKKRLHDIGLRVEVGTREILGYHQC